MHGKGTKTWANGNKYEGDYVDDKMHGKGTYTWASDDKYVGNMANDKMHGQGTKTRPDGTIIHSGAWENGNPV